MTMTPVRLFRLLILALTATCAACALQEITPVKPAPDGGKPPGALKELPTGPGYAAPQLAIGQNGSLYLLWLAVEYQKSWDVLLSRSEDFGATWVQPPISLKPMKASVAGGRQIATGPDGKVYVLWREWDPKTKIRQLQFVRLQDHGMRWDEPPRLLNAPNDVGFPQLFADHDGGVFVASLVGPRTQRSLQVMSSDDFGATFPVAPIHLTTAFPTSQYSFTNHRVTSDGAGHLYVVWEEIKTYFDHRIYLNRLTKGKGWEAQPILVSAPAEGEQLAYRPEIIAMPDGRVYVIFERDEYREDTPYQPGTIRKPDRFIYVNRSLDYGQTWLPQPIRLNSRGQGFLASTNPQLSSDRHGNVYAVWIEEEGPNRSRLLFARSTDSGMSWSAPNVRLDLSSPFKGWLANAEIRSDDEGHVWVLWQELSPDRKTWQLLMNQSNDYGKSWLNQAMPLIKSGQRGGSFRGVSFLHDAQGRLYVAWDGGPENSREMYFNRSTDFGATWLSREIQVGRR